MENQEIRIITLPPMRFVTFHAFSSTPELEAWEKMISWAKTHNRWQDPPAVRVFGFNNPDPSPGSPNYGYEYWLTIGVDVQPDKEIKIKDFSGGMYGVLRCEVGHDFGIIGTSWQKLVKWLESSHYKHGKHQWLEEHLMRNETNDQDLILDLYIPIIK